MICYYIFTVTTDFGPKKKKKKENGSGREWESFFREWNGMGFSPSFFVGLGRDEIFFLWEWDGRGLKIHSRVTLYFMTRNFSYACSREWHSSG